ncbi:MAG: sulfatase [Vicinamibacteria bacterium]
MASSLVVTETVLTYATGQIPAFHFGWILLSSATIALAGLLALQLITRIGILSWLPPLSLAALPIALYGRGADDPLQVSSDLTAPLRILVVLLLTALLVAAHPSTRLSMRRLGLVMHLVTVLSSAVFLWRSVPASVLRHTMSESPERFLAGGLVILGLATFQAVFVRAGGGHVWTATIVSILSAALYSAAFCSRVQTASALVDRPATDRPNVVLVVMDAARRDAFSVYGSSNKTVILDELSRSATVFTRAYTTGTYSLPGHGSLFSGLLGSEHGGHSLEHGDLPLLPSVPTVAGSLRSLGYRTLALSANASYLVPQWGLQRGFEFFDASVRQQFWFPPIANTFRRRLRLATDQDFSWRYWDSETILKQATKVVHERTGTYLLFVNLMDAHEAREGAFPGIGHGKEAYAQAIRTQDANLGTFLASLRDAGNWDRTLLIVTSDHGELQGEHGYQGHHEVPLYEGVLQVPLIVKFPHQKERRTESGLVTLADLKGLIEQTVQGGTWAANLSQPRVVAEDWYEEESDQNHSWVGSRAVYSDRYKLIDKALGRGNDQLYDLGSDPQELTDLYEADPSLAQKTRTRFFPGLDLRPGIHGKEPVRIAPTSESLEKLRALGYLRP